jgi:hypothetical protein
VSQEAAVNRETGSYEFTTSVWNYCLHRDWWAIRARYLVAPNEWRETAFQPLSDSAPAFCREGVRLRVADIVFPLP